ncbi:MAG: hypothetical protein QM652_01140 [Legionella sp.]|uniref:hypothetical protein n=1 Tax=Legionella sp. TaxID=459 RepID=UPI0039E4281E
MPSKTEKIENPVTTANSPTSQNDLTTLEYLNTTWKIANFALISAVTSSLVLSIQTPVKTALINLMKYNTVFPPISPYNSGLLGIITAYYAGTKASISTAAIRSAYVTNTRGNKQNENMAYEGMPKEKSVIEEGSPSRQKVKTTYVAASALGEVLLTQVPESLSQLKKIPELLPDKFKWYKPANFGVLFSNGIGTRYCTGLINFAAMLQLEDKIADSLPIKEKTTKHAVAGMLSGVSAAVLSYPFTAFKDYASVQMTINKEGNLVNKGSFNILKELFNELKINPRQASKQFINMAKTQIVIKSGFSGVIFTIVATTEQVLSHEPLAKIVSKPTALRFFSASVNASPAEKPLFSEQIHSPF